MESGYFHHALEIIEDICIGCSHCMTVCPTEAIRVKQGKAKLFEDRCVDCGQCYHHCPVNAIRVAHDDFNDIFNFKYRVVVVPTVFIGQFPEEFSTNLIYNTLHELGFTHVIECGPGVELLMEAYSSPVQKARPLISSFCPAIVRLIQVKFPSLVDNVTLLKAPLDIAALLIKKKLTDSGIPEKETGIFYITPCAAQIAAIKNPQDSTSSLFNGVINMDLIYNKVYSQLHKNGKKFSQQPERLHLSKEEIEWTLTNGEAVHAKGRSLAIDEIHNVIDFLEKLENETISDVDFLELRACDQSCAGGILGTANRFLTVERLRNRGANVKSNGNGHSNDEIIQYAGFIKKHLATEPIKPQSMLKLDEDMLKAMNKMKQASEIMRSLPGVDCGICGTPGCSALAEDIVRGNGRIEQCIFIQRRKEQTGTQSLRDSFYIMEQIWGRDKLE
ncbi:MAG: [Fe-Fe] hydrogenase large subunit C-terminal domain-containing protein [Bacteroidota bacterium]|nr:[Fe-Fe] hydrogenase large subunit C-terminal domain-containing protein [Bacteroidota bacterium]MDP4225390.1 [Fe-Fe] hydrogenase large subunit C-terminal domain-containing protein [Bacteroidota bacterium]MDP4273783.1 [Fe-Fe] hydrogenase large subunit C-terminal domain-containing protein [Bacteroidota bacterium]